MIVNNTYRQQKWADANTGTPARQPFCTIHPDRMEIVTIIYCACRARILNATAAAVALVT